MNDLDLLDPNPFIGNRVTAANGAEVHVAEIHAAELSRLQGLALQACRERSGVGAVLVGEAGIGKSHVLARLQQWIAAQGALPVLLHNPQTAPARIPRYLLKCLLQRAVQDGYLTRWISALLRPALDGVPPARQRHALYTAWQALIGPLRSHPHDAEVYAMLFRFFENTLRVRSAQDADRRKEKRRAARLARRWLEGDFLDPDEMKALDHRGEACLADDEAVVRAIVAVAQLARLRDKPLVLLFDQVDNLDPAQLTGLSRFLHALLDACGNLLVVTSGVQESLFEFKDNGTIGHAAWDRLAGEEIGLQRIYPDAVEHLLQARLAPVQQDPRVTAQCVQDPLFPLGRDWFTEFIGERVSFRPREALRAAKLRFARAQDDLRRAGSVREWLENWRAAPEPETPPQDLETLVDAAVMQALDAKVKRRTADPAGLPPDAGHLCELVETLLRQCLAVPDSPYPLRLVERVPGQAGRLPPYQVYAVAAVAGATRALGLCFVVTANKQSAASALKRLLEDPQPPERLFLICDEREPLQLGAAGRDYLDRLHARGGFTHSTLAFADYCRLDALRAVLADARADDLELDLPGTHCIDEEQVRAAYRRLDLYRQHPLLQVLLTVPDAPAVNFGGKRPYRVRV